jgi:hypothetical protein
MKGHKKMRKLGIIDSKYSQLNRRKYEMKKGSSIAAF